MTHLACERLGSDSDLADCAKRREIPGQCALWMVKAVTAASIGELADELAGILFRHDLFWASAQGMREYAGDVPDLSPQARQAYRDQVVDIAVRCDQQEMSSPDVASQILLEAVRDKAVRELAAADARVEEFSVTTFPLTGPSAMLLVASRTPINDAASAEAYLARCRRLPVHLDQCTESLQDAARDGLLPVAPLVADAIRQLREHMAHPERDPMLAHRPPEGWAGAAAWRDDVEQVVRDEVRPAIGRYIDAITELLPASRPAERAGLLHVPGGVAAYACCVRNGTTLPMDPDEIHRIGLAALAEIEERIAELGSRALGSHDIDDIVARLRDEVSRSAPDGGDAMTRAAQAVARAQERVTEMFHAPLPTHCVVEPMPPHLAAFGAPPFYTPPARDGSQPGTYHFNSAQPGQAGSWALEATAFHEAVPGHHVQFSRMQLLPELPLLLSAFYVVPHGEGWGLYAERLADELGLYSDDMQRLGMLASASWRAVRLVVDSGLHARGWSRGRALQFALTHSPMPEPFISAEIDRYIALPGQALGYYIGQQEILRLRDSARARLGAAYDIRDFHSAVLDHGSLPLTLLGKVVDNWATSVAEKAA
jgi:uncharacterized protein (DUF885 family)